MTSKYGWWETIKALRPYWYEEYLSLNRRQKSMKLETIQFKMKTPEGEALMSLPLEFFLEQITSPGLVLQPEKANPDEALPGLKLSVEKQSVEVAYAPDPAQEKMELNGITGELPEGGYKSVAEADHACIVRIGDWLDDNGFVEEGSIDENVIRVMTEMKTLLVNLYAGYQARTLSPIFGRHVKRIEKILGITSSQ